MSDMDLSKVWAVVSFESTHANAEGNFPLELNVENMMTGETRKIILAMTIEFLAQFITDLEDLLHTQETVMYGITIRKQNGSDPSV